MSNDIALPEIEKSLAMNVQQMGGYLLQMASMMANMQKRMDEMEAQQRAVTMSHDEVKIIQGMIRTKAGDYCLKYDICSQGCLRSISAGIRKAILTRYGVKDLHDVPAIARQAVEAQIQHWSDVRLMMKCREKLRENGP